MKTVDHSPTAPMGFDSQMLPDAKEPFDPDATMIIDRRGKIRTHEDLDYRSPEVWVAKIRNQLLYLKGLKETGEGREFVRAVTAYLRTKDVTMLENERILKAFNLAHLAYENFKKSKNAKLRPSSQNLAERICNEIAAAYRIHSSHLLDQESIEKQRKETYAAYNLDPKNQDLRKARDLSDELSIGFDGYARDYLKRSKDNAGYLILHNARTLFLHLGGITKSEKLKSGKLDPVSDDRLASVFVKIETSPKPNNVPKAKSNFSERMASILNSDIRSLFFGKN